MENVERTAMAEKAEVVKKAAKVVGKVIYENGKNLMIAGLFTVTAGYCGYKAKNTALKAQQELFKDGKAAYRGIKEFARDRFNNEED